MKEEHKKKVKMLSVLFALGVILAGIGTVFGGEDSTIFQRDVVFSITMENTLGNFEVGDKAIQIAMEDPRVKEILDNKEPKMIGLSISIDNESKSIVLMQLDELAYKITVDMKSESITSIEEGTSEEFFGVMPEPVDISKIKTMSIEEIEAILEDELLKSTIGDAKAEIIGIGINSDNDKNITMAFVKAGDSVYTVTIDADTKKVISIDKEDSEKFMMGN